MPPGSYLKEEVPFFSQHQFIKKVIGAEVHRHLDAVRPNSDGVDIILGHDIDLFEYPLVGSADGHRAQFHPARAVGRASEVGVAVAEGQVVAIGTAEKNDGSRGRIPAMRKPDVKFKAVGNSCPQRAGKAGAGVFLPVGLRVFTIATSRAAVAEAQAALSVGERQGRRQVVPTHPAAGMEVVGSGGGGLYPGGGAVHLGAVRRAALLVLKGRVGNEGDGFYLRAVTVRIVEVDQAIAIVVYGVVAYLHKRLSRWPRGNPPK